MDEAEIVALIADLETDRVERNASLPDADRCRRRSAPSPTTCLVTGPLVSGHRGRRQRTGPHRRCRELSGPDGREIGQPDLPFEAVQQVVRNAVIHRACEATTPR